MEEMHEKMRKVSELKEKILEDVANSECKDDGNIEKAGAMIDMVKDLASAEKDCAEAAYYMEVVKAMREEEYPEAMGYNTNRYANGHYAPSGHGDSTRGYHPSGHEYGMNPMWMGEPTHEMPVDRMGYPTGGKSSSNMSSMNNQRSGHETSDHYVTEMFDSIKEIYDTSNPEMKAKLKENMGKVMNEMR